MSTNFALPSADVVRSPSGSGSNTWTKTGGGTTNLWQALDEVLVDESDYIHCPVPDASPGSVYVTKLSAVAAPPSNDGVSIHYWLRFDPAGIATSPDTTLTIELREGYVDEMTQGTVIHSDTYDHTDFAGIAKGFGVDLTPTEVASVTDWSDLYVRYVAMKVAESDEFVVYNTALYVPAPGANGSNVKRTPKSAILGQVRTSGSVNGAPLAHLLNPSGSGKKLVVYGAWIHGGGADGGSTTLCRADLNSFRRTGNPLGVGSGGTTTNGHVIRLDETNTDTIVGVLEAFDFTNEQFHEEGAGLPCEFADENFFEVRPSSNPADQPFSLREEGAFPITLMPGSALEVCWRFNGSGFNVRLIVLWDEVTA